MPVPAVNKMNLLKYETSPYLLQHADNPVHWQPWSEAAFEKAKAENKPVLLSIGYSSCHWCHVMEHESFEDEEVAAIMNHSYINIKLDREEYPDIDHLYMDAVQAMTGSGGWPLNVFLTPDKKPFYGGTYFPPVRAFNRASWKEVLINVSQYFTQNRSEVESQAAQLMEHLQNAAVLPKQVKIPLVNDEKSKRETDRNIFEKIMAQADKTDGGFGNAPKFPSTFIIKYLLDYYGIYQDETALKQACLSLDKMAMGGIYDHIGGGFARYSTDKRWIVPHFEKMLYDNALLLEVYVIAYSHTKNEYYREKAEQTVRWLQREMMSDDFAFYSAQDADSEGVEGKYYTWTTEELKDILQDDFKMYKEYYQITDEGNWEHTNILYTTYESYKNTDKIRVKKIYEINKKLFQIRSRRIKPLTDDKILLGWNALMNKALVVASLIFGNEEYLVLAQRNMDFLINNMNSNDCLYHHTHKNKRSKIPAFLDDLAYLSQALIQLSIASADPVYLHKANKIIKYIEENFRSGEGLLFDFTNNKYRHVSINKKETYDGAVPSSNSVLCNVLQYMGYAFNNTRWSSLAEKMLEDMQNYFNAYPASFGVWAAAFLNKNELDLQVTIIGKDAKKNISEIYNKKYLSYVKYVVSTKDENIEELQGKYAEGETRIFICKNKSCLLPFTSLNEAMTVIL